MKQALTGDRAAGQHTQREGCRLKWPTSTTIAIPRAFVSALHFAALKLQSRYQFCFQPRRAASSFKTRRSRPSSRKKKTAPHCYCNKLKNRINRRKKAYAAKHEEGVRARTVTTVMKQMPRGLFRVENGPRKECSSRGKTCGLKIIITIMG